MRLVKRWRREAKLHQWLIQGLGNTGFGRSSPRSQVHPFSLELNLQYPAPTTCNHLAAIRAGTTCLGADRGCTAWGQGWTYDRVQIASSADGPWPRVTGRVVCILWSVNNKSVVAQTAPFAWSRITRPRAYSCYAHPEKMGLPEKPVESCGRSDPEKHSPNLSAIPFSTFETHQGKSAGMRNRRTSDGSSHTQR